MRLIITAAAASLAIATAACNKPADTNAASNDVVINDGMGNDSLANDAALAPMAASDFASTIAGSDMFEIASGKLAETNATNADLKSFAKMLVTDHGKSSAELKTAAAAVTPAVTLPTAIPAELQAKLDALKAAKGAAFDSLFLEQQKDGHSKALDALNSYSASGDAPSLKAFAAKAVPVVQGHLDKLNAIKL